MVDAREKEKVDLFVKTKEELATIACKNTSNKVDCSKYWEEFHKEFLEGIKLNKEPKIQKVNLYAKKYLDEHGLHSNHGHGHGHGKEDHGHEGHH